MFDLAVEGTDQSHILRAYMGLYLGMIVLWVLGAVREKLARAAVISEIAFMFGLAAGRILSIIFDGLPSVLLIVYTGAEIALGSWGILILRRLSSTQLDADHTTAVC